MTQIDIEHILLIEEIRQLLEAAEQVGNVRASDLAYWDVAAHAWVVEPGPVELLVGNSSRDADLKLSKTISVVP